MKNTERINKQFEQKHLRNIKAYQKRLQDYYEKAIDQIFTKAGTAKLINDKFSITQQPVLKKLVDKVLLELKGNVETLIVNGIDAEWNLAETKSDAIISDHLSKKQISEAAKNALFTRREEALEAFKSRKSQGLNLSDRVWNYNNQFRGEIEQGLYVGISEGKSAVAMARDQKQYLKDPDKLFRRVRDAKGNLQLSKSAKEFKPGKGVYRSSFKNALRLTRTETNMSYRSSDNDRYARTKFILGVEVKLSANHPVYDICDHLAGKYPPAFKFRGWHPQCLCFTVPVLPSLEEYDKYEDAILAGNEASFKFSSPINNVPANFTKYMQENKEMLNRLKSTPYWIKDNKELYDNSLKAQSKPKIMSKKQVQEAVEAGKITEDIFKVDGEYTPERKLLHDKIIKDYFDGYDKSNTDQVYMLGGAPANGKSTVVDSGLLPHPKGSVIIDADKVKSMIPEYRMMIDQKNKGLVKAAANFVHEESSYLGKIIREKSLKDNYATIVDGVNDGKIDKVIANVNKIRKDSTKSIRADYVSLDSDLSEKLAIARAKKTGRDVPIEFVKGMNSEISKLVPQLIEKNVFDELYLWDTNLNGKPRLILKMINGKLSIADQKLYDDFLKKAN